MNNMNATDVSRRQIDAGTIATYISVVNYFRNLQNFLKYKYYAQHAY